MKTYLLLLILGCNIMAQDSTTADQTVAHGTFEVQLKPMTDEGGEANLGRMTLDKQFSGDLVGTSKGQMLTAMTATQGSAGYVAVEKVTATLNGKKGSFILQHNATMTRGEPAMNIIVVPDSGTDDFTGMTGHCIIKIEGGKHFYELHYHLP